MFACSAPVPLPPPVGSDVPSLTVFALTAVPHIYVSLRRLSKQRPWACFCRGRMNQAAAAGLSGLVQSETVSRLFALAIDIL